MRYKSSISYTFDASGKARFPRLLTNAVRIRRPSVGGMETLLEGVS